MLDRHPVAAEPRLKKLRGESDKDGEGSIGTRGIMKASRGPLIERSNQIRSVDLALRQNHDLGCTCMRDLADKISQGLPINIPEQESGGWHGFLFRILSG
jgi:hypothetical protein